MRLATQGLAKMPSVSTGEGGVERLDSASAVECGGARRLRRIGWTAAAANPPRGPAHAAARPGSGDTARREHKAIDFDRGRVALLRRRRLTKPTAELVPSRSSSSPKRGSGSLLRCVVSTFQGAAPRYVPRSSISATHHALLSIARRAQPLVGQGCGLPER